VKQAPFDKESFQIKSDYLLKAVSRSLFIFRFPLSTLNWLAAIRSITYVESRLGHKKLSEKFYGSTSKENKNNKRKTSFRLWKVSSFISLRILFLL